MFGTDAGVYLLGYQQGEADTKNRESASDLFARAFLGRRPVQVDQSYLDRLHTALDDASSASDYNYALVDKWKEYSANLQAQIQRLEAEKHARENKLAGWKAYAKGLEETLSITRQERDSLRLFFSMTTALLMAHAAGRGDTSEFGELRDMAQGAADRISHGDIFDGYKNQPEKKARWRKLIKLLLGI